MANKKITRAIIWWLPQWLALHRWSKVGRDAVISSIVNAAPPAYLPHHRPRERQFGRKP